MVKPCVQSRRFPLQDSGPPAAHVDDKKQVIQRGDVTIKSSSNVKSSSPLTCNNTHNINKRSKSFNNSVFKYNNNDDDNDDETKPGKMICGICISEYFESTFPSIVLKPTISASSSSNDSGSSSHQSTPTSSPTKVMQQVHSTSPTNYSSPRVEHINSFYNNVYNDNELEELKPPTIMRRKALSSHIVLSSLPSQTSSLTPKFESYDFDDDDCTVRVSNMKSTQKPSSSSAPSSIPPTITTSLFEMNQAMQELQKEWNTIDENITTTVSSSSNIHTSSTTKPRKSIVKKTSNRVKKILKIKVNCNDHSSCKSSEAIIQESTTTSTLSERFVDLWLKMKSNGKEEILMNDSKENILMGTPLRIGIRGLSNNNSNNNDKNKNSNKSKVSSPLRMKKSRNFSLGSPVKLRNTKSEFFTKIGSPSKKTLSMVNQKEKYRGTLNNQSNKVLRDHTAHDSSLPQHISQYNPAARTMKDDAIKGRLDGIDVLSLGAARFVSYIGLKDKALAGQRYTLRSMVNDTLWACSGREIPEIVLEGFSPAGNDRWTATIEGEPSNNISSIPNDAANRRKRNGKKLHLCSQHASTKVKESDYELSSQSVSTHLLLTQIWGKDGPPPPTNAVKFERTHDNNAETAIRAITSCPIDSKKNLFIITDNDHLQSAYSIAVVPLKYGSIDDSIAIFHKVLRSLEHQLGNRDHHLIGSCHHNLGVLQMWTGRYEESLTQFNKAIAIRIRSMTVYHPCVAVSLSKIGFAYFAMEQLDKAQDAFQKALDMRRKQMHSSGILEISKLCNNIAVIHYQQGNKKAALAFFHEALELMKRLIQGPVRRESLVYDTSIILSNLGKIYLERGKNKAACRMFEEALLVQTSTFQSNHNCILTSLGNIAFARASNDEVIKALQIYKSLKRIQINKFGSISSQATETKGLMAMLYIKLHKYKEANSLLKEVSTWQQQNLDENHPALANTQFTIRKLRQAIKGANQSFADV